MHDGWSQKSLLRVKIFAPKLINTGIKTFSQKSANNRHFGLIVKTLRHKIDTGETISGIKDKDYCPIEIIKGLTDKGQFQYLTKLMGPQEGTYLYATQFHSLR